jgi:hypothetical protein
VRLDEALADERREREQRGRGIAAGVRDEARPGGRRAEQLRQAVPRAREQLRRGVREAVVLGVGLRVAEAEGAAEIDDAERRVRGEEPRRELRSDLGRRGEERDVALAAEARGLVVAGKKEVRRDRWAEVLFARRVPASLSDVTKARARLGCDATRRAATAPE